MALYPYAHVEKIEEELDKIFGKLTEENFIKRRKILADNIFPMYDKFAEKENKE